MILSIGEILADMIGEEKDGQLRYEAHVGGAPFNLAYNASLCGAEVGFYGKVGCDPVGGFILDKISGKLPYNFVRTDPKRNTTLAFVTLSNGERSFAFFRRDTADFHLDPDEIDFRGLKNLTTVHIGSLMLSEEIGRKNAVKFIGKAKEVGARISFDFNLREDLFGGMEDVKSAYKPVIDASDIVKFSEDELSLYSGRDVKSAAEALSSSGKLVLITMGKRGSAYYYRGQSATVPTEEVEPVDTTGCGDAFFGAFLACVDGKELTDGSIKEALVKANAMGAATALFKGAVIL